MSTSDARIKANQENALKSTGPKTEEGKARSRANALKHGLTGSGMVLPNEDEAEVEAMFTEMARDMKPATPMGRVLVKRMATMAIRLDRCVAQESAALSRDVDQAEADFLAPNGLADDKVAQLRAKAGHRAMFDPSHGASLARRYEAATERSLYTALKEFRKVEREARAAFETPSADQIRANRQELLASFGTAKEMTAILESLPPATPRTAPSKPVPTPAPSPQAPVSGPFDVAFSIGKPR